MLVNCKTNTNKFWVNPWGHTFMAIIQGPEMLMTHDRLYFFREATSQNAQRTQLLVDSLVPTWRWGSYQLNRSSWPAYWWSEHVALRYRMLPTCARAARLEVLDLMSIVYRCSFKVPTNSSSTWSNPSTDLQATPRNSETNCLWSFVI